VISRDRLRTGHAPARYGKQVRLFDRWIDATRARYLAYDFRATP
jgi:hypothetical protein